MNTDDVKRCADLLDRCAALLESVSFDVLHDDRRKACLQLSRECAVLENELKEKP